MRCPDKLKEKAFDLPTLREEDPYSGLQCGLKEKASSYLRNLRLILFIKVLTTTYSHAFDLPTLREEDPYSGLECGLKEKASSYLRNLRLILFIKVLTTTYSHMGSPTLPSALNDFTSEFEMGSGGAHSLWSSG